jgi:hypothetical protein
MYRPREYQSSGCELAAEAEAARAALAALQGQDMAISDETSIRDAEAAALETLVEIRRALGAAITASGNVDEARAALRRVFSSFVLHYLALMLWGAREDGREQRRHERRLGQDHAGTTPGRCSRR